MNEILTATIAKQIFHLEKEAYAKLNDYLTRIRKHFASHLDKDEIIFDIESGIAEHLKNADKVVSEKDIDEIILQMGAPEDMGESRGESEESARTTSEGGHKKLYRNTDDAIIAGVASGIATYFNIDPIILRLIFVASLFAGGTGAIIYLILWVIVPETKTSTDRLKMQGKAITLESMREIADDGIENIRGRAKGIKKIGYFINRMVTGFVKIFTKGIFPIVRMFVGLLMMVISLIVLLSLLLSFFMLFFNIGTPYVEAPFLEALQHPIFYAVIILGFLIASIPVLFFFFLARIIITKKNTLRHYVGLTLLGVWITSLIAGTALLPRIAAEYEAFADTNPVYQEISKEILLEDFSVINVSNSVRMNITQGNEQKVTISGQQSDIDEITVETKNGKLILERGSRFKICFFFCNSHSIELDIVVPNLTEISIRNSSSADIEDFVFDNLKLNVENSSKITLERMYADSMEADITNSSQIVADGEALTVDIYTRNSSSFKGYELLVQDALVSASNSSRIEINTTETLDAKAENSSSVRYLGNPEIIEDSHASSKIERVEERL